VLEEINPYNEVLLMLQKALNNVEIQYISQEYLRLARNRIQRPERVFVAELYHQLRKLQESTDNIYNTTIRDLVFHCEIGKINYAVNEPCLNDFSNNRTVPDLVLHKSQDNKSPQNQQLVCEVKSDYNLSEKSFIKDLKKLLYYKLSDLRFQNAVFIYTGEKNKIDELLARYKFETNDSNIINCLCKNEIRFALRSNQIGNNTFDWKIYQVDCKSIKK
jgi:hypothetical protein